MNDHSALRKKLCTELLNKNISIKISFKYHDYTEDEIRQSYDEFLEKFMLNEFLIEWRKDENAMAFYENVACDVRINAENDAIELYQMMKEDEMMKEDKMMKEDEMMKEDKMTSTSTPMEKIIELLPIYTGTYNTLFEYDEFTTDEEGNPEDMDLDPSEYREWHVRRAQHCVSIMERYLIDASLVSAIKFISLNSPREYNFRNDTITVEYMLSEVNLENIYIMVSNRIDEFQEYLTENFSSHSGFISFIPTEVAEWMYRTQNLTKFYHLTEFHINVCPLSVVLEFLCDEYGILDEETLADESLAQMR